MAKENPFRFSTKFQDDETELLYYGYRYYNAKTGTWGSRDPIDEPAFKTFTIRKRLLAREQGKNAYCFLANDSIGFADVLGLSKLSVGICEVVVFYGHGTQGKPHEFDSSGPCCAGAFIGCYNAETNDKIPKNNQIPGVVSTDDELSLNPNDGDGKKSPFQAAFDTAWNAAQTAASAICKKCKCLCTKVTVKAVLVKTDTLHDAYLPDEQGTHPPVTVDCSKVK